MIPPALLLAALVSTPASLWEAWPAERFVATPAPCIRHADLVAQLRALAAKHPDRTRLEEIGRSAEGRPVQLLSVGSGETRVLLWSQMHGDEPSATPALLDVAEHLLSSSDPEDRAVLGRLTLLMVPMLNPDGAERYARRNALGIDVNRDALNLATPEGRLLKDVRDRYRPLLGFNLHDQDRRTTIGDTGKLATIALLAVAGDPQGTITEGRMRAKRVCAAIVAALEPLIGPSIARYDEDWSPRAFGDNLTAWGTPVVLIESGGLLPGRPFADLTRLNFVALVTVLRGLAADDLAGQDPALYESLTRNHEDGLADVVVRGGRLRQGPLAEPYRADLAFDIAAADAVRAGCPGASGGHSRIVEIGDARFLAAGQEVDATGAVLVPAFTASVRGFRARRWLTAPALEAMARLGVGRVRWHVAPRDLGPALAIAASLAGPLRPAVEPVAETEPLSALVVSRPPKTPEARTLEGLAAALGAWTRSPEPAALVNDAPASFLVLRGGMVESVYVDGRLVPAPGGPAAP